VVGRNAVVTLQPGPGIRIDNVVGQQVAQSGTAVEVVLGDLTEGEYRDIIVRATAEGRRAGASVELMDVTLAFEDAVAHAGSLERRVFLGARATDDQAELTAGRNVEVERAAAQMQAAAVTVEAIQVARGGELDRARAMLQEAEVSARSYAEAAGDETVAEQASSMRALTESLPTLAGDNRGGSGAAAFGDDMATPAEPAPAREREEVERDTRRLYDRSLDVLGF
jgi:hypothetical protein